MKSVRLVLTCIRFLLPVGETCRTVSSQRTGRKEPKNPKAVIHFSSAIEQQKLAYCAVLIDEL